MKRLCLSFSAVLLFAAPGAALAGPISLFEAAFNVGGSGYSSISGFQAHDLDAGTGAPFDVSAFDFGAGLGSILIKVGGAGAHSVSGFFDFDLTDANNSIFDDEGEVLGVPAAGQSFEIDEPGYAGYPAPQSDIYAHVFGGALENANDLNAPDDVSMALAWDFVLAANENAVLVFSTSATDPGGFRLRQFDQSGAEVFLSSSIRIAEVPPVPEPVTGALILVGAAAGALRRFRARV